MSYSQEATPLEMWGGLECTVNRVGDRYLDQLDYGGHAHRVDDLDRFAALGLRTLRYPVLWERTAPNGVEAADWTWPDERLTRLRSLGISPIVGLLHHGSGPPATDLLDPAFPNLLARFAEAVAARYPWVTDYTPVNEPLTTARFSALYGHWYPHCRDMGAFLRATVNQCQAITAAMRAIRAVNSAARLVQTEDLGETFSTPALADQAGYENHRRWLSLDLLCGRVVPSHPLWEELLREGVGRAELEELAAAPCPPDIVGINHYLTSERFLDERLDRYPAHTHGGNAFRAYADIEAVRVCADPPDGWRRLLREAWERYGLPVAATEVHLGSTREEQLRWLIEVWDTANELRTEDVDVRAVTAWSLLGAFDWNSLATREDGHYEPGVFDVRFSPPRPTALARIVADLAAGRRPGHPALAGPGWWRRPERLLYPPLDRRGSPAEMHCCPSGPSMAPVLIAGTDRALTRAFADACAVRGLAWRLERGDSSDNPGSFAAALDAHRPWAIVLTGFDGWSESGAASLAAACAASEVDLLVVTTGPHSEASGQAPHDAAHAAVAAHPATLVVHLGGSAGSRLSPSTGGVVKADLAIAPLPPLDLIHACLDLLIDRECGWWQTAEPVTSGGQLPTMEMQHLSRSA